VIRLSVIIPTFNRAPTLEKCLHALGDQTCDVKLFEVIVSDDGSTDRTRDAVGQFARRVPLPVRHLYQKNSGANAARNWAIRQARGGIVLLINDDIIATPRMLAQHLEAHERYPDDRVAVLGRVTVAPTLPPSRLAPMHLDRAYAGFENRRELDWRAFFTCNVSVKKSLLDRGGLFDEAIRYHEDLELAERLSHHGLRVIYQASALGYHDHFLTEEEFLAVAAREGRALAVWARKAPRLWPVLGTIGFEPALPLRSRIKHQLVELAVNRATIPLWRSIARHCPRPLENLSLRIYKQIYGCVMRAWLRREFSS